MYISHTDPQNTVTQAELSINILNTILLRFLIHEWIQLKG